MSIYSRTKDFKRKTNVTFTHMYLENCQNCGKTYIPKRRGVQKYCTTSCRSRAYQLRKSAGLKKPSIPSENRTNEVKNESPSATINAASIMNAFIAAFGYDAIKGLLTPAGSKTVTRNDLDKLIEKIDQRYIPIRNVPMRSDGTYAFCDKKTESLVYLKVKKNGI